MKVIQRRESGPSDAQYAESRAKQKVSKDEEAPKGVKVGEAGKEDRRLARCRPTTMQKRKPRNDAERLLYIHGDLSERFHTGLITYGEYEGRMSRAYEYYRQDLDDDQKAKKKAERLIKRRCIYGARGGYQGGESRRRSSG